MRTFAGLATFFAVSAFVIVTPGPDTAMTIRNTLVGGRVTGLATVLGVCVGQSIWTIAASLGLTALLVASEPAFLAVRIVGAAYLCYVGCHTLWAALRQRRKVTSAVAESSSGVRNPRMRPRSAFWQGVLSDLANPKMAMFYMSLLPQFVSADQAFQSMLALGALFAAMTFIWLGVYALIVAKAGDYLRRSSIRRVLDAVMGTALIGLGIRMAAESR